MASDPRALGAQRLGGRLCMTFMPRRPGAVQCRRGEGLGAARGADLPALPLPPLRGTGADLPALRSRQHLLRRGVLVAGTPRGPAPRRRSLSAHPARGAPTCAATASLPRAPPRSDASGLCKPHRRLQGIDRPGDLMRVDRMLLLLAVVPTGCRAPARSVERYCPPSPGFSRGDGAGECQDGVEDGGWR